MYVYACSSEAGRTQLYLLVLVTNGGEGGGWGACALRLPLCVSRLTDRQSIGMQCMHCYC